MNTSTDVIPAGADRATGTSDRLDTAATGAPAPLTSDLCWLMARASHALTSELTAALEESGISPRDHAVLTAAIGGEHTQTELARTVGLDKTTMVVTVDELEAHGLVARVPSPTDRRARLIRVTSAGDAKLREANKVLDRVREDVLSALPTDEREVFLRALARLACGRLSEPIRCVPAVRRRA